jgi:hypothetical protein
MGMHGIGYSGCKPGIFLSLPIGWVRVVGWMIEAG